MSTDVNTDTQQLDLETALTASGRIRRLLETLHKVDPCAYDAGPHSRRGLVYEAQVVLGTSVHPRNLREGHPL